MGIQPWDQMRLSQEGQGELWELFHENSKIGRLSKGLSDEKIRKRMGELHESLMFVGYPSIVLPRPLTRLRLSLSEAILTRVSARTLMPCIMSLKQIATLLHYAYGISRDNKGTAFPRPFRVVPSGGGLYPLELFFHSSCIGGLSKGLYHYNPAANNIRHLRAADEAKRLAEASAYPELVEGAAILVFITAVFERSIFKYGERGYRFVLLEAGHVAQNLNLVSNALGLGSVNIGGFFDREIDDFLELDGVRHSTIYICAMGQRSDKR